MNTPPRLRYELTYTIDGPIDALNERTTRNWTLERHARRGRPRRAVLVALGVGAVGTLSGCLHAYVDDQEEPRPGVIDVSGTDVVTVTYRTTAGETEEFVVSDVDPDLVDGVNGWAFIDRSALPPALKRVSSDPDAGVVVMGNWALVGELASDTKPVRNGRVTVVVPAGRAVDAGRKTYFLSTYLSPYALAPRPTSVTIVAAPDALPHRGVMYPNGTGYVTITAFWDGRVNSVWIHEYLHAQQHFQVDVEMRWSIEGSAEYLTFRVMQEQYSGVSNDDVVARLERWPDHSDAILSDPTTWDNAIVDHVRGARLLYRLDGILRTRSTHEYTLFDVFYAMNRQVDAISVETFCQIVENHSGADETWLREAITQDGRLEWCEGVDDDVFTVQPDG